MRSPICLWGDYQLAEQVCNLLDRKRWEQKCSEYKGGPIYAAVFPEDDVDENDTTCSTCADIGKCGVISVDDEHLMSGCDLHRRRTTST